MSLTIKGIKIEIEGNAKPLSKALEDVDKKSGKLQRELSQVEKLLKFNPGNTNLVAQKQQLLADKVANTGEKLKRLKSAQDDVNAAFQRGDISVEKYREFQREIAETESKLKHFETQLGSTQTKLERVAQKAGQAGDKFKAAGSKMNQAGKAMSMKVTAPIAGIGAAVIKTGMDFEAQMSKVSAISGATGEDLKKLEQQARDLGKSTEWSATQAAEGQEKLALAGWETNDIMSAMPDMLNLATAGALDLGQAADIVSDNMQAFGLSADQAGHAADIFAHASSNSNTDISQMAEAMKYVAPVANSFKLSMEDVASTQMIFADAGLKGSIAGQAFASSLTRLSKPTNKMTKEMDALGINFFDAQGQMKSMPEIVKELEVGMKGMTDEQKANTLATIFGAESYKHWALLLDAGSDKVAKNSEALKDSDGATQKMADTMRDNAKGGVKELLSALQELALVIYDKILPALTPIVKKLTELAQKIASLPGPVLTAITAFAAFLAIIGPILVIVGQMTMGIGGLLKGFQMVAPFLGKSSKAFGAFGKIVSGLRFMVSGIIPLLAKVGAALAATNPIVWVIVGAVAALIAIGVALYKNWDKVKEIAATMWEGVKEVWSAFIEWAKGIFSALGDFFTGIWDALAGGAVFIWESVKAEWMEFIDWIKALWEPIGEFFSAIWSSITEAASGMWDGLKEVWSAFVGWIKSVFSPLVDFFTDTWESIGELFSKNLDILKSIVDTVWQSIKDITKNMWEIIKNAILGPILLVIDLVTGKTDRFKKDLSQIWGNIKQAAINIWNSLGDGVKAIVTGFIKIITNNFSFLKNTLAKLWTAIKTAAINAWNGLKNGVIAIVKGYTKFVTAANQKAKDVLLGVWNAIKNGAVNAWNALKNAVVKATKATVDFFVNSWKDAVETFKERIKAIVDGAKKAWSTIKTVTKEAFLKVAGFIKNPLKAIKLDKIGKDIINGLIKGIKSMFGKVKETITGIGKLVPKTIRKILSIKSPSRVMMEVGGFIGEGLVKGLNDSSKPVDEATARLANRVIDTVEKSHAEVARLNAQANADIKAADQKAKKDIQALRNKNRDDAIKTVKDGASKVTGIEQGKAQKLRDINGKLSADIRKTNDKAKSDSVKAERSARDQIQRIHETAASKKRRLTAAEASRIKRIESDKNSKLKEIEQKRVQSVNQLNADAAKKQQELAKSSSAQILSIQQKAKEKSRNLTKSEADKIKKIEADRAKSIKSINDKLAKDIVAAEKKKAEQVEKIKQEEFQRSKDYIRHAKDYEGMSMFDELKAWERVQARYKKGTEQRKEADEKALDAKKAINDKLLSLNDDYIKRMDDVNQKYLDDAKKLTDDYKKAVDDRTNSLVSFTGIFDEIAEKSDVSGEQLMANLKDQVYAFKDWSSDIRELSKRGLDEGLLAELQEMGPKAGAEIKALTSLSDKQLNEYAGLWKQKNMLAKNQATSELQGMKEETKQKISELHAQTNQQLTGLVSDWQNEIAKIRTGTADEFNVLSADMNEIGANAMKQMIEGMQGFDGPLKDQIKNISGTIGNTVNQSLSLKAPKAEARKVGKSIGSEIAKGIESMQSAVKQATAKLADIKIPVAPRVNLEPLEEASRRKEERQTRDSAPVEQKTEIKNEFNIASLVVREEADIEKVAIALLRLQEQKNRGRGYE